MSLSGVSSGGNDIFLIKFNSADGSEEWVEQMGTSGNDEGYDVAVDESENVYVTGTTTGSLDGNTEFGHDEDLFLVKFTSDGNKEWTKQIVTAFAYDEHGGVATDLSGNIYISGTTTGDLFATSPGFFVPFLI